MASKFILDIVTPFGKTFSQEVHSCIIPGSDGQFQVLQDHAALVAKVDVGVIKIKHLDQRGEYLATSGGFSEIKDNVVKIMLESAEFSDKIDAARAGLAKDRAEKRLKFKKPEVDIDRAKISLLRALNRIKAAEIQ
jgi:F-type H+-transporting ATPase subunit epsilon